MLKDLTDAPKNKTQNPKFSQVVDTGTKLTLQTYFSFQY